MEHSEQIISAIKKAGKALKGGEIADLTGIDKKDVDKVIKKLKAEEKIFSPKVCFYDVKK
ncbi:MAG: MarR family transcriptional regulator [Bacteroidetes bacterium GWA2_30_7]|nr:MAG: MarR family transcriptional regulator [Bacteroidetes bacterium GWA2_30_7]